MGEEGSETYQDAEREDVGWGVLHCSCPRFGAPPKLVSGEALSEP